MNVGAPRRESKTHDITKAKRKISQTNKPVKPTSTTQNLNHDNKIHKRKVQNREIASPNHTAKNTTIQFLKNTIVSNTVVIFSKSWCQYCKTAIKIISKNCQAKHMSVVQLDKTVGDVLQSNDLQAALKRRTGSSTVPQVFIDSVFVGGCDEITRLYNTNALYEKIQPKTS